MLARLEEFETMFAFIQPDVQDSRDLLKSILDYKPEFDDLCQKIDSTEFLMAHIKSNLDALESQIEEREAWLGVEHSNNVAEKVSSILTPLFVRFPKGLCCGQWVKIFDIAEKVCGEEEHCNWSRWYGAVQN